MKAFIVLSAIFAVAFGRPGVLLGHQHLAGAYAPLAYAQIVPGAPVGLDGRVVDTPEVSLAKAEHAAAHVNERINLAHEAVKSADVVVAAAPAAVGHAVVSSHGALVQPLVAAKYIVPGAPIGLDGRVVDTPEVAVAKAEHAAAHINQKIDLAHESARSGAYHVPLVSAYSAPLVQKYYV